MINADGIAQMHMNMANHFGMGNLLMRGLDLKKTYSPFSSLRL